MRNLTELEWKFTEQLERSLPNISNEEFKKLWYLGITIFYKGKFTELPKSICKFDNVLMLIWVTEFRELSFLMRESYMGIRKCCKDVEFENYDECKLEEYREWLYGRADSQD